MYSAPFRFDPSGPGYHFALAMIRRDQNDLRAAESELKLEAPVHPESTTARQQLDAMDRGAAPRSPSK